MDRMDFHIHSDYSDDADSSLEDIVAEALRWGLEAIGVVDHFTGDDSWLDERQTRVSDLRAEYAGDIEIFTGIEVEVIDDKGALDIDDDAVFGAVDFIVTSFHGTPEHVISERAGDDAAASVRWWVGAMRSLLTDTRRARVIGHPDRILIDLGLAVDAPTLARLVDAAVGSDMFLEWNPATTHPVQPLAREMGDREAPNLVYASDAHSIEELAEAYRGFTSIEAGIVERGNAAFRDMLMKRRARPA